MLTMPEVSTVPHMGQHIFLDYVNVTKINLADVNDIKQKFDSLLQENGFQHENYFTYPNDVNGHVVILSNKSFRFSIDTFPENKTLCLDIYFYNDPKKQCLLIQLEKVFSLYFGYENNSGYQLHHRGNCNQFILNDYPYGTNIYRQLKYIHREFSEYQDIRVFDDPMMGRILALDSMVQITDNLDDNYTVDLTKKIVIKEQTYENILMIGGGDMYIATYLLEDFPNVKKITVCDIDPKVTETVRKYFSISEIIEKEIAKGRLEITFQDGADYIQKAQQDGIIYDGIIIDCTDVEIDNAVAASLFTDEFYQNIYKCLKQGCAFSQQVTDDRCSKIFEQKVKQAQFTDVEFVFSDTPEYGAKLPLGIARKH